MIKILKALLEIAVVAIFLLVGVGFDEQLEGLTASEHPQTA